MSNNSHVSITMILFAFLSIASKTSDGNGKFRLNFVVFDLCEKENFFVYLFFANFEKICFTFGWKPS